jgi:hypothetical protein
LEIIASILADSASQMDTGGFAWTVLISSLEVKRQPTQYCLILSLIHKICMPMFALTVASGTEILSSKFSTALAWRNDDLSREAV